MSNLVKNHDSTEIVIQYMEQTAKSVRMLYDNMKDMKAELSSDIEEMKQVQESLKRNITLTRGEEGRLKSAVYKKSIEITKAFFKKEVSEELFNSKRGHTIAYIWTNLKDLYDVSTYPQIPHIEFENALNNINGLSVEDFPEAYYRLTPKMQRIVKENKDMALHIYFGESSEQEDLFENYV